MATALVTGSNRGIGLELCRQLVRRGDEVIAVARKASPALSELGISVVDDVDVTDEAGLSRLRDALSGRAIDLLINNAGVLENVSLAHLDVASIRRQLEVNAIAPLRVTHALLGNLGRSAKVALITSRMGSIADNDSGGSYGYRMSKAALNAAGKSLAVDLAERGVAVAILHPGWVKTDMTAQSGLLDVTQSASMLLARIDALTQQSSGTFWHADGTVLPW